MSAALGVTGTTTRAHTRTKSARGAFRRIIAFMDNNDPYADDIELGVHGGDVAFERWCQFMIFPGFGWVAFVAAWHLPAIIGLPIAYVTLYASACWAWPKVSRDFWAEFVKQSPTIAAKVRTHVVNVWNALKREEPKWWAAFVARLPVVWRAIIACIRVVPRVFGAASKWLAERGAPLVARLNRWAKSWGKPRQGYLGFAALEKHKPAVRENPHIEPAYAARLEQAKPHMMGLASPEVSAPEPEPEAPAPKPKKIDWSRLLRALADPRFWALIAVCAAIIFLARCSSDIVDFVQPSGREVAAENRAEQAQVNEAVAEHGRDVAEYSTERAEETNQVERRTERAVRMGQEDIDNAIEQLPPSITSSAFDDLNRRYHDGVGRVWNDSTVGTDQPDHSAPRVAHLLAS